MVLLLLPPTLPASEGVLSGSRHVADALVVGPNDTLVLAPGAALTGPGSLEVWGRLEARGEPGSVVTVAIPVRLHGAQEHVLSHTRLWGVNGTAMTLSNGSLRLDSVVFEASGTGLLLDGAVRVEGANVTFRAHPGDGLRVGPLAQAHLDGGALEDNGVGARVAPGGRVSFARTRAVGDVVHVYAEVERGFETPRVVLDQVDFGPTAAGGIAVRAVGLPGGGLATAPALLMQGGAVRGSPIGIHATHARIRLEGATLEDNAVGLSLGQAAAELKDVRLGNARDVEGAESSQLLLENVTYLRPQATGEPTTAALAPAAAWPWWVPWLAMASVALLAGVLLWNARAARRAPPAPPGPAPSLEDDAPAEPEPAALPPEPVVLGPQERRILEDVRANPDTPQAAVAERIGLTRQAVHYHVKKLEARGLLAKTVKGRETQCRLTATGEAALSNLVPSV